MVKRRGCRVLSVRLLLCCVALWVVRGFWVAFSLEGAGYSRINTASRNKLLERSIRVGRESIEEAFIYAASFGKYDPSSRAFSELNCSGKLLSVHGAFCDLEGYCRITGITVAKDRWMRKVLEAVEIRDGSGRVLAAWEPSVHFEGHSQKRIHDAFWVTLRLHKSELKQLKEPYNQRKPLHLDLSCYRLSRTFPDPSNPPRPRKEELLSSFVWLRQRRFTDKIVVLVTQYYSKLPLEWVHAYLTHYKHLGADYVVLYTAFDSIRWKDYSDDLDKLLGRFNSRVIRYDWFRMDRFDNWAYGQTSMIFHGANIFWGAMITILDFDEILYFGTLPADSTVQVNHMKFVKPQAFLYIIVNGGSLRTLALDLNARFNSWGFHYQQYMLWEYNAVEASRAGCLLNFTKLYQQATPPSNLPLEEEDAGKMLTKYIFRSLSPHRMQVHTISFEPGQQHGGFLLNASNVVMLHIKSLATEGVFKLLPSKWKSGTACDYNSRKKKPWLEP